MLGRDNALGRVSCGTDQRAEGRAPAGSATAYSWELNTMSPYQNKSNFRKRSVRATIVVLGCLLTTFTMVVSPLLADDGEVVRLVGSRYGFFVVTDFATVYMQDHKNAKVVVAEAEPYTYLQCLSQKTADAIMTLGKLDDDIKADAEEQGMHLSEQVIAWGAVALITHPKNPITELSIEQVRKIFLGEYRNWNELGGMDEPIVTVSRDDAVSGTLKFFQDTVLGGNPPKQETVRESSHDIVRAVWQRKGSIADARYTEAMRGKLKGMVKIIAIKKDAHSEAVTPSTETTRNHSYPISFPLVLYYDTKTATPAEMPKFIQFCALRGLGPHYVQSGPE
jgi:phosphate transport system substrate-binding protein